MKYLISALFIIISAVSHAQLKPGSYLCNTEGSNSMKDVPLKIAKNGDVFSRILDLDTVIKLDSHKFNKHATVDYFNEDGKKSKAKSRILQKTFLSGDSSTTISTRTYKTKPLRNSFVVLKLSLNYYTDNLDILVLSDSTEGTGVCTRR